MSRKRRTSPTPLRSSTRRTRQPIPNDHLNRDLSPLPENLNDRRDQYSVSDAKVFVQPFMKAMGKRPSDDSFPSTLGKRAAATQLTLPLARPLHPVYR